MKWNKNNVSAARGNFRPVIAKFDNSRYWLSVDAICSVSTAFSEFRRVGKLFCSKAVEVKYLFDDDDKLTESETNIVDVHIMSCWPDISFRRELPVPEGTRRQFQYFKEDEVFPIPEHA